jgi:hypothetical protein
LPLSFERGRRCSDRGMSRSKTEKVNWRRMWNEGTDTVMDVPIGGVYEIFVARESDKKDVMCNHE